MHNKQDTTDSVGASLLAINSQPRTDPTNWPKLYVTFDFLLAGRFTEAYRTLNSLWNQEARKRVESGRRPLAFEQLITIDSHGDHQRIVNHLAQTARPAITIASGGMCSGGRKFNYVKAMLEDKRHDVLFISSRPKAIQTYGPKCGYVKMDGERIDIRAGITSIAGDYAHADQEGWLSL
ncbi:hypothetical protein [Stutzerimonas zhaodongensis]|uniref:hypothetical protein n=1 Tax=Stutzerimonas TaxID=2901164 RepID=UPI00388D76F1